MSFRISDPIIKQHRQNLQIYKKNAESHFIENEIRYIIPMFVLTIVQLFFRDNLKFLTVNLFLILYLF